MPSASLDPEPLSTEEMLAMQGSGWDGDLDAMRRIRVTSDP